MPNVGSFLVYSTIKLDSMKLLVFNHFDLQKCQGHILQPNRSLNNTCICLPLPFLGSSALFGSWKSRNYQRYFAVIVDECCDVPPRFSCRGKQFLPTHSDQPLGILLTGSPQLLSPLRDCLSAAWPKVMLPSQGSPHIMTDSRRDRKVWSSHFNS